MPGTRTTRPVCGVAAEVRERYLSGATVTVEELLEVAGLSEHECHVIRERLTGRPYAAIAKDEGMRKRSGGRYTRQRVKQVEEDALAKLGVPGSLGECVHADDRVERGLAMRERGRRLRCCELHADPKPPPRRRYGRPAWERKHEEYVARFLAGAAD